MTYITGDLLLGAPWFKTAYTLTYRCMPNIKSEIARHNNKILKNQNIVGESPAWVQLQRGVQNCPMEGKCLQKGVIYQATILEEDNTTITYTGVKIGVFSLPISRFFLALYLGFIF